MVGFYKFFELILGGIEVLGIISKLLFWGLCGLEWDLDRGFIGYFGIDFGVFVFLFFFF